MTKSRRHIFLSLFIYLVSFGAHSQVASDLDYLPENVTYNPDIPKPADVLGYPVGEWHVRHDQLVNYMYAVAEASDRVTLIETGRTYENRPLLLLAISKPENQGRLEEIRKQHISRVENGARPGQDAPLVLWMGYSVHGDEASGSNAALLVTYYLAAAQGQAVDELLNDNVILLDPSLNPDGLSRFAQWANMHKSKNLVADPQNREHIQGWPSGRTNHYWFDLNRDWLLLTHPESRARIAEYHRWRPHVLTDFHEMGPNSSYFFQPGIPSRTNPWTPEQNVALTNAIGKYHAAALDAAGELYFTQEAFDDFYYGKGSTYPDAHGTIGILFEQGSSRGHLQDTINGPRHFSDAVQNQVTTSLSTFKGALANKQGLLDYLGQFQKQTEELIKKDELRGYLVSEGLDKTRFNAFKRILDQHNIAYSQLSDQVKADDKVFDADNSIFVSLDQPQYRLIRSIFSSRKRFMDNTFYDVSNWNLALAFNLQYTPVNRSLWRKVPLREQAVAQSVATSDVADNAYAIAFSWHDSAAPALMQKALKAGADVRASGEAISVTTTDGQISLPAGSVMIPMGLKQPEGLIKTMEDEANKLGVKLWSLTSGLTEQGIDLGSRNMRKIEPVRMLIVGGRGTSQYEVGEAWHYLDQRVNLPVSIIELDRLGRIDLTYYTHVLMVNGNYNMLSEQDTAKLNTWVRAGGVLIGQKAATRWFVKNEWLKATFLDEKDIRDVFETDNLRFGDREAYAAKQRIAGAAFETRIDLSHPLAFGLIREQLPVFKNSTNVLTMPEKPFVTAAQYTHHPLMAGYAAKEMQALIADSAAIVAHTHGRGRIIGFVDNPNFRGYWYGTSRLLSNAVFMAPFINAQG